MSWVAFLRALAGHLRVDLKRARGGHSSARSPRVSSTVSSPANSHQLPVIDISGKPLDYDALLPEAHAGPGSPYHTTYLHLSFVAADNSAHGSDWDAMGKAAAHALAAMAQPAALVVLDPAGALLSDPRTVRALAKAVSALRGHSAGGAITGPAATGAEDTYNGGAGRAPCLQLASCTGASDWGPVTTAVSRLAATLPDDPAAAMAVRDAVIEAARQQYLQYGSLLAAYSHSRMSVALEPESSLFECATVLMPAPTAGPGQASLLPGQTRQASHSHGAPNGGSGEGVAAGRALNAPAVRGKVGDPHPEPNPARRSHSLSNVAAAAPNDESLSALRQRFLSVHYRSRDLDAGDAAASNPVTDGGGALAAGRPPTDGGASCDKEPAGTLTPVAVDAAAIAFAGGSASSSSSPTAPGTRDDSVVPFAVESARRYAALLEAVGRLAPAAAALEACVSAAAERWGERSNAVGAVRSQLGRLQQLQGLHRAAEVTWRQALEALERCHGHGSPPVLLGQVALATVLAALREGGAEDSMRSALAALDAARGPSAPETLAARRALAELLAQDRRWAEAEVAYQSLLEAQERAPPPPSAAAGAAPRSVAGGVGGGVDGPPSTRSLLGGPGGPSRSTSRQQLVQVAPLPVAAAGPAAVLEQGPESGAGTGDAGSAMGAARGVQRSDSRARVAWAGGMDDAAANGAAAAPNQRPGALPALAIPRSPRAASSSPPSPLPLSPVAHRAGSRRWMSSASLGPGNADAVAWSGDAAALADVVAAVQRELGGVNELYDGMHLAGPEGSTSADLAALAAVCPRSGACVAAVVSARRLTDPLALYDAALSARRAALGAEHPTVLALQLRCARHLSAAGQHAAAEAACRAVSAQLGSGRGSAARVHPAELAALETLGAVLQAAGSLPAAAAALTSAAALAEQLVAAGELAAADARRIDTLNALSDVLFQRATASAAPSAGALAATSSAVPAAGLPYIKRAMEAKCQALDLTAAVVGQRHERVMRGWAQLGAMAEAAGDLRGAERSLEGAAEVALHLHGRRAAATKAIFRQLQRVYQAQGRTADAEVLSHMYRLNGGLLAPRPAQQLA